MEKQLTPAWVLFAGVVGAGCLHAVLQEQLMHTLGRDLPLLITSFEFGCCSTLSLVTLLMMGTNPMNAPRLTLLRISLLVLASLLSGNVALRWVSYPVKVRADLTTLRINARTQTFLQSPRHAAARVLA